MRWPLVGGMILVAAALGTALWFFLFREGGLLGDGRTTPEFTFDVRRVETVTLDGDAPQKALTRSADELRSTLDAMYVAGFVDPDRWEEGTFPEVLDAFADQAARAAEGDLSELTLGAVSRQLEFVQPGKSRLDVEFLVADNGRPFAAVATVAFRATGELAGGGTLNVTHRGRYLMRPIDGRWRIVSYEVEGKQRPAEPAGASP